MAYINAEQTAQFRAELKAAFPSSAGWKLSVVNENHSTISVAILQAPINFLEGREATHYTVHFYDIKSEYPSHFVECFQIIKDICNKGNYDNSDSMSDYFDVGWYFDLSVGKWDKPFKYNAPRQSAASVKEAPQLECMEVKKGEVHIIEYSDRSIVVIGDTKPIKDKLKAIGGVPNWKLACGFGWVFPKSKLEIVTQTLSAA